jgi:hypothetical protein
MEVTMAIDGQRIAAGRALEALGYIGGEWLPPAGASPARQLAEADALHGMLMRRADTPRGLHGRLRVRDKIAKDA